MNRSTDTKGQRPHLAAVLEDLNATGGALGLDVGKVTPDRAALLTGFVLVAASQRHAAQVVADALREHGAGLEEAVRDGLVELSNTLHGGLGDLVRGINEPLVSVTGTLQYMGASLSVLAEAS